jgi:hypothetical protein
MPRLGDVVPDNATTRPNRRAFTLASMRDVELGDQRRDG